MADGGKAREVKVVLLGDTGVGKSSLVLRFVTNNFRPYSESTIGASFMSKMIVVNDTPIKYQIWDTAGQEKVLSMRVCCRCMCACGVLMRCVGLCVCLLSYSITVWRRCTTAVPLRRSSCTISRARYACACTYRKRVLVWRCADAMDLHYHVLLLLL